MEQHINENEINFEKFRSDDFREEVYLKTAINDYLRWLDTKSTDSKEIEKWNVFYQEDIAKPMLLFRQHILTTQDHLQKETLEKQHELATSGEAESVLESKMKVPADRFAQYYESRILFEKLEKEMKAKRDAYRIFLQTHNLKLI